MSRKQCSWTRKLELDLVEFIKQREYIWKLVGNTNHDIQMKYKAYAEYAALVNRGFTARDVRDRWINIRSTFNGYLRKLEKSKLTAKSPDEVYVPCWPLWKPLHFLLTKREEDSNNFDGSVSTLQTQDETKLNIKEEVLSDFESKETLNLRQRKRKLDRPKPQKPHHKIEKDDDKCKNVLDDLVKAMKPLAEAASKQEMHSQTYWYLGRHVTERLNAMNPINAEQAGSEIMALLKEWPQNS